MSVLDEVVQKRDYAQSRKDSGEQGYDDAIDFYNRIITDIKCKDSYINRLEGVVDDDVLFDIEPSGC